MMREGDTITPGGVTLELVFTDDDHDYVKTRPIAG
jgi:hypothetical protein